jgi:Alpha-kinase family/von Willebrand factor type A domain
MASPPSYPQSVSMSRSRTSPDNIRSVAEVMLRSSLSSNPSSSSSTATTLPPYTEERSTSTTLSSSSRGIGVGPSSPTARDGMPAAAMHLPSSGSSSISATTSRTRERLRLAELERDELRRAVEGERAKASEMQRLAEEERAIAERLKREGGPSGLSAAEAKLRVLQLKQDARAAGAESSRRPTAGLFKAACSTDLLFLIDTTGSMSGHINAAKEQVKSIMNDIKVAFLNEAEVRIAVVGYKDHLDKPNIQFLDFTPSADRVRSFLNGLTATGGNDAPEDVLGGIRQALNVTWKQQTRCIIHIADAPPHGRTLHDFSDSGDSYPNPGSEPHGLTHESLLKQMIMININYALLRINDSTDRMAFTFFQAYAAVSADCKLHKFNRYNDLACDMFAGFRSGLPGNSKHSAKSGLLFEEAELGTTYSALRHLVVKSVTTSASRTAVRVSSSAARISKAGADKKLSTGLAAVEEEDDADDAQLEITLPRWSTPSWLNETLIVEGFSLDVVVHGARTLNDMMARDDNIKMSIAELTIHKRSQPFAQGAMRIAFYARTAASTNRFVVKSFKLGGKRLAHLAEDMRCQALCKAFALEFNALSGEEHSIDFIVTTCLKGKSGTASGDECMSLEPFIEGTYVKYNNNCGYVNEDNPDDPFNKTAQAFSHFTFERSRGAFLVSDLQGVGHVLTDPAVHALDPERFKLADTNLGKEGFKFFFATHVCNDICRRLDLKSNSSMIMSGKYQFRERWPIMDNTVCCSNRLCGKIVRLTRAKKSDKFPGYHWCDMCWPQLRSSMDKWICVAPGPHHEFDVSKFFYESQGRIAPRKCPEHYDKDETGSRAAVVGGNFWARLKVATRKKSIISGKNR